MEEKDCIEKAFQTLINTKHLYQSVNVDYDPLLDPVARQAVARASASAGGATKSVETVRAEMREPLSKKRWNLIVPGVGYVKPPDNGTNFWVPPVKTFCGGCKAVEAFNPVWGVVAPNIDAGTDQVFCMPLECQGCKKNIIVFLVYRSGIKIQLVGRSEFEDVQVPSFLPKQQRKYYSQALIAFQSGHTLPALFMLRTLIEQHMRAATGKNTLRGDELCDQYAKTLPAEMTEKFPSFKVVYGNLSDALHRADENAALFESEIQSITLHFEALELFSRVEARAKNEVQG